MSFKRDLVIATWNPETNEKVLYQIAEADWKKEANLADGGLAAEFEAMLNQGAVLAAVPELGGTGVACYLVNLASINVDPYNSKG